MANPEHVAILRRGVEEWNAWRNEHQEDRPDLKSADLTGLGLRDAHLDAARLGGTRFSGADLTGAFLIAAQLRGAHLGDSILRGANLRKAHLIGADLQRADLADANLHEANLSEANLRGANLNNADLRGANLSLANLAEANLLGVTLQGTTFGDTNLTGARHLEGCVHHGPSTLDHRTTARSGELPRRFLRGVGLPDRLIDNLQSLLSDPIQFYSCFISYATADELFAKRLHADLQDNGVRCWFAHEDLKIGDELRPTIDDAVRLRDKLLVVLSETSIGRPWVKREVEQAIDEEQRRGKPILFPIRLDDAVLDATSGWTTDVKRRFIGDFSAWKEPAAYQAALDRLLRDLRAETREGED